MAVDPIHPASPRPDRKVLPGHDTRALGPSDSSDTGSDVTGAGREVGDADLDSDSDRFGTGEREAAGREPAKPDGSDIAPDHIVPNPDEDEGVDEK